MANVGVDTSIYSNIQNANPLAAITNAAATVNAVQQNKLTGQTIAARNSLSNIIAQSTEPDGSINYAKAKTLAASDPNAALIAPELQSQNLAANTPTPYYDTKTNQIMVAPAQHMGNVLNPKGNQVPTPQDAPEQSNASPAAPVNGGYQGNPNVAGSAPIGTDQAIKEQNVFADKAISANEALTPLRRVKSIVANDDFSTGPLEPAIADVYGKLSDLGIATKGMTDQAAQMQEVKKNLAQSLQGTYAQDSNMMKTLNSKDATPTPAMLREALQATVASVEAAHQADIIKNSYMVNRNFTDVRDIRKATDALNYAVDPRLIQFENASPEQANKMIAAFKKNGELPTLMKKYQKMQDMGLFSNIP